MEALKGLLKPPTPRQQVREWQHRLRNERISLDRRIRELQREEKKVERAIREAAKRDDTVSAKILAKELVRSRRAVNRLYENKAQLNSVSMRLGQVIGTDRMVTQMSKSTEVMKMINNLMKAPELAVTMQQFRKEMMKAEVTEEMANDMIESALDSDNIEDEIEEEVDKVLAAVAAETATQLPVAARKQRINSASINTVSDPGERQAIAEDSDNVDDDLDENRARLAKVRS
uniref:Uncharacterized protein n=1 Tax=Leersia perrieri TaxID=77586 RepID=A0A0D9WYT0_9ORYZ